MAARLGVDFGEEAHRELGDGDALLLHGVAVADGHGVVVFGVEVVCHAEGRADFVLAAVALSDGAAVIVVGADVIGAERGKHLPGTRLQLLGEWQDGGLDWRHQGGQPEDDADVLVLVELLCGGGVLLV